jgi:hypothetical protein
MSAIKREILWMFKVASPGELPDEEALKKTAVEIRVADGRYSRLYDITYTFLAARESTLEVVKELLERVRGEEGILASRASVASLIHPGPASVLTAVGIHARRSVYVLHYARVRTDRRGRFPHSVPWVKALAARLPEAREEVKALQERLFERYPLLREASLEGLCFPPLFIEAVPRGQVVFGIGALGRATHVVVAERALFSIAKPYKWEELLEASPEALVRVLRKRTLLKALPPKAVRDLLEGRGDTKTVERLAAMARLGRF